MARPKSRHQFTAAQGINQHRQKRRRGGNVEDTWFSGRHALNHTLRRYCALSAIAASAAVIVSGVPTCIHRPPSPRPESLPAAAARVNSIVSENAPFGALANKAGEKIAAPA